MASKSVEVVAISADKLKQAKEDILAPLKREKGYSPAWVTQILQSVMIPNFVLYIKKERMMNAALAYVEELKDHHGPMLIASDRHHLRLANEIMNKLRAGPRPTPATQTGVRQPPSEPGDKTASVGVQIGEKLLLFDRTQCSEQGA